MLGKQEGALPGRGKRSGQTQRHAIGVFLALQLMTRSFLVSAVRDEIKDVVQARSGIRSRSGRSAFPFTLQATGNH